MTQTNAGQPNPHRPAAMDTQKQSRDLLKFIYRLTIYLLVFIYIYILDMHPLAAASRSILLETEPKLFVFETLYYAFMRSVDDIVLNISLRKLSKHDHSIEQYCIELLDSKQNT